MSQNNNELASWQEHLSATWNSYKENQHIYIHLIWLMRLFKETYSRDNLLLEDPTLVAWQ